MLEELKKQVRIANQELERLGLVKFSFGNVSALSKSKKFIVIKPSGIPYKLLREKDMVVLDLKGNVIEGNKKPSSDLLTHLEIYRNFQGVNSVIHIHSEFATLFAQAKKPISCLGTTHADHFYGDIPITRDLTKPEIKENYELNTGKVIVETFKNNNLNPLQIPACLVSGHGPFVWGETIKQALKRACLLEFISKINVHTLTINPKIKPISKSLLDKHYQRKHGPNAYYGQK